jgi:hypothetical protein
MKPSRPFFVFGLFLFFTIIQSRAAMLNGWHWRNPTPFANQLNSICYGDGKFVAVGAGGVIHTSPDGVSWDDGRRPVTGNLYNVIFVNGQFFAVGGNGAIVTSADGYSWTNEVSGTTNTLYAIAYGNGQYVACGQDGTLAISTTGTSWQLSSEGTSDLDWIAFGNGVFVLPAANQQMSVLVSRDAQTWATETLPNSGVHTYPHILYQAAFGNGVFVAICEDETYVNNESQNIWLPTSHFYQSPDGTNWIEGAEDITGPVGNSWQQDFLTFQNGFFYEFTTQQYPGTIKSISQTYDGTSVNNINAPSAAGFATGLAYGNGTYVLTVPAGQIWTSADATNWTAASGGQRDDLYQILYGNGHYVALAGLEPILITPDGINFTPATNSPSGILTAAAYDGTNYVAVGGTGNIAVGYTGEVYTSTNSTDWVSRTSNASQVLTAVCRGSTRWVAVGINGTVISSPTTLAWTLRSSGTANNLNRVAFGNGTYVAVGNNGTIISSPDGATWDVQYSGTMANLTSVRFLNGQFFAVGLNGTLLSSPDGSTWTILTSGTTQTLNDIAYGNGYYLVCGNAFLDSTNGADWQDIATNVPVSAGLYTISCLNGSFWLCGTIGTLVQSDSADGIPHLAGSMLPGKSGYQLKIILNVPPTYRIQVSTNLMANSWQDAVTNTASISTWTDTNAFAHPFQMYRVVSP